MLDINNIFIFIIWEYALDKSEIIVNDINNYFNILNIFNICWDNKYVVENIKRFYGINTKDALGKIKICGCQKLKLIVVEDNHPNNKYIINSKKKEQVNLNIFNKKMEYRSWTGNDHKVHSSNNVEETKHDLTLLLGKNTIDYLKSTKKYSHENNLNSNLVGYNGWEKIEDVFYVLNNCCNYVVLRDFENDFKEIQYVDNYDIDILCENKHIFNLLINSKKNKIRIMDKHIEIDAKGCSCGYYCKRMCLDILNNKEYRNFYYVPNFDFYYYSILYHSLIHKSNFIEEYNQRLESLFEQHDSNKNVSYYIEFLEKWLDENNYKITLYDKINIDNIKKISHRVISNKIKELINNNYE